MPENRRQDLFSHVDLQRFRERQMADLEHRSFRTMAGHAAKHGYVGAPTAESELQVTFTFIQQFAERQVDKMKRMGLGDEDIRVAVLGSIQNASVQLPMNDGLKSTFNQLLESANYHVYRYIQQKVDKRQFNLQTA